MISQAMTSFLVTPIPDARHEILTFELSSHSAVNTFGFAPVGLKLRFMHEQHVRHFILFTFTMSQGGFRGGGR